MQKFITSLMFVGEQNGKAEEAIKLYTSVFKNSQINHIQKYTNQPGEKEGAVQFASFSLNGQEFSAMDSGREHNFTFTPAMSITVVCESEEEIDSVFKNYQMEEKFLWNLVTTGLVKSMDGLMTSTVSLGSSACKIKTACIK